MNKRVKSILWFIIILSLLAIIVILMKMNSRLPENPADYVGNTAGNLYNRGLFAEDEDYIYFANVADSFRLYRADHALENVVCLNKDSVEYINPDATSTYLYYSRINYRQNTYGNTVFDILSTGIYRFDLKRNGLTRLYPDACGSVLLAGNSLFYQTYGDDGNFDTFSLPVNEKKADSLLVTTDYIQPVNYKYGQIYYSGVSEDHALYALTPETGSSALVADLDCFQPIITSTGIFFLSLKHNYALFYLPDSSDTATLITNKRVSAYNISTDEQYLFYQVDNGEYSRLCCYDLITAEETELLSGNYKNLNTVSGYLFFTDFNETLCYCYDIASDSLYSFMPVASED